ncbi:MAG: transglutaminase domain-containing protein [Nitrospirota bacterium]|nr:MAG: transglutaminase domain-containing protein [Nitrospirota bacterium]
MKTSFKIINIAVLITWIIMLSIMLFREHAGITLGPGVDEGAGIGKYTSWYDIYKADAKIGYASTSVNQAGNEIVIDHIRAVMVEKEGKDVLLQLKLRYLNDINFSPRSFMYSLILDDKPQRVIKGEIDGKKALFFLESDKGTEVRTIDITDKEPFLPLTILPAILKSNPSKGSVFVAPVLNIENMAVDRVRIVLEDIVPFKLNINIESLFKFMVGSQIIWCDKNGNIVKESLPNGTTLYSQSEIMAKDMTGRPLVDFTSIPLIGSSRILTDVEKLKVLKLKLNGYKIPEDILGNTNVTVEKDVLTISKYLEDEIKADSYKLPLRSQHLDQYTQSDEWIDLDAKLKRTGRAFAGAYDNDSYRLTHYLRGYVHNIIGTRLFFTPSNSSEVLNIRMGDHLEKTVLATSYARAAGMPARMVGGLVYRNGFFYFHSWVEIWFNKWVPMDPSLVQFPADVSHIPLAAGSVGEIISIIEILDQIEIEVLEAE